MPLLHCLTSLYLYSPTPPSVPSPLRRHPCHLWGGLLVYVQQSWKHVLNQPPELHGNMVKAMLNPTSRQWCWLARNIRLRSSIVLGCPRMVLPCPNGLTAADVGILRASVKPLLSRPEELPLGCKAHIVHTVGSTTNIGNRMVLDWTWDRMHTTEPAFDFLLGVLQSKFLAGQCETAAEETEGEQPPQQTRGMKRAVMSGPLEPVDRRAPLVREPSTTAIVQHQIQLAVEDMMEEESLATVVEPPFVVGKVKPYSAWPHGGVVIFVQFPFLLDETWKEPQKWVTSCRKLLSHAVGGRYEVVFEAKKVLGSSTPADSPGGQESPCKTTPGPAWAGPLSAPAGDDEPAALPVAGALPTVSATVGDALATPAGDGPMVGEPGHAPAAAAGPSENPIVADSDAASVVSLSRLAVPDQTAQPPADAGGLMRAGAYDLGAPSAPADFKPLSQPLQRLFVQALDRGPIKSVPVVDEQLMVKILARSPESVTSFVCTFSCDLELGRWENLPGGTSRCDNMVTAAYAARDPSKVEAEIVL